MDMTPSNVLNVGLHVQFGASYAPLVLPFVNEGSDVVTGLSALSRSIPHQEVSLRAVRLQELVSTVESQLLEATETLRRVRDQLDVMVASWGTDGHEDRMVELQHHFEKCHALSLDECAASLEFEWNRLLTLSSEVPGARLETLIDRFNLSDSLPRVVSHCYAYQSIVEQLLDIAGV